MSYANIEKTIQEKLNSGWTATEIEWQNTEYEPTLGTPFIRVTIIPGSENNIGLGSSTNLYRKVGVVFFSIFVPPNTGTRQAWNLADDLTAIFRGLEEEGVIFREIETNEVGEENGWFQVNVSVAFQADDIF